MATIVYQGLLRWGSSTVLPVREVTLSPNVQVIAEASAGDTSPSQQSILGGRPSISFSMPADLALATFGTACDAETALALSLIKVDAATGLPAASAGNLLISLASGAKAYACIEQVSASQGGMAVASCMVYLVSADGTTHPLSPAAGAQLSLSAQPQLMTMGSVTVNGSELAGAQSTSVTLAHDITMDTSDGDKYPTLFGHHSTSTTIEVAHGDPDGILTALGLTGVAIASSTVVKFLDITSGVVAATGTSLTIAGGIVVPGAISGGVAGRATTGLTIAATGQPSVGSF